MYFLRIQLFSDPRSLVFLDQGFLTVHKSVFLFRQIIVPESARYGSSWNVNSCHYPELSDQLAILQSYPLLLRKYWADWQRWPFVEANQCFCVLPLKCIDFFPPSLLLNSPLSKALVPRNTGCSVPAKSQQHFLSSSIPRSIWFAIVSSVPLLGRSRLQERPMTARESFSILFNCLWIIYTFFHHFLLNPIQRR